MNFVTSVRDGRRSGVSNAVAAPDRFSGGGRPNRFRILGPSGEKHPLGSGRAGEEGSGDWLPPPESNPPCGGKYVNPIHSGRKAFDREKTGDLRRIESPGEEKKAEKSKAADWIAADCSA
jgi:hypothetical protein